MSSVATENQQDAVQKVDWTEVAKHLGKTFAQRAPEYDQSGEFVAENYKDLKKYFMFSAGIPVELGGGGACYLELVNIIREFGRNCGSTALAFAMHTHPVATNVFNHLHGNETATNTLKKIASKELAIAGTGANDWLHSSGKAERVDGGYRVQAEKRFVSGAPGVCHQRCPRGTGWKRNSAFRYSVQYRGGTHR